MSTSDVGWASGRATTRVRTSGTATRWLRVRTRLDRVLAAVLLVPAAPVLAVLALVVRRQDDGPGLVRLPRVGRGGEPFRIHKLRTMHVVPEGGHGGSSLTAAGDRRITPLGHALRRWRVDEVPQLLDVVAGRMALLGPRPETPPFVDQHDPRWQRVLQAPPGIAGPTQVIVHGWESDLPEASEDLYRQVLLPVKLAIDAWYLEHASPALDLRVLVSLVQSMAGHERTVLHRQVEAAVPAAASLGEDLAAASGS